MLSLLAILERLEISAERVSFQHIIEIINQHLDEHSQVELDDTVMTYTLYECKRGVLLLPTVGIPKAIGAINSLKHCKRRRRTNCFCSGKGIKPCRIREQTQEIALTPAYHEHEVCQRRE